MIYNIFVPNEGPLDAKVWFVGESPGEDEEFQKRPFVGMAGQLLRDCIRRNGLSEDEVRFCNLSNYRPEGNKFERLLGTPELEKSFAKLRNEIETKKPNLIVPLGKWPLIHLTGKESITKYRGSIIQTSFEPRIKVIPTFHPSNVSRDASNYPLFDIDIQRIAADSKYPECRYTRREYIIAPDGLELHAITDELCAADRLAVDIESVRDTTHILCVGFATSATKGVCIPYTTTSNITAINKILESNARKIFHFGTFDIEMLKRNGHVVNNYWWDTIIGQHVLNPELPRGLDFLASIYTREPYYKSEGRGEIPGDTKAWSDKTDKNKLYIYNCKDVCVTAEIQLQQQQELDGRDKEIFDYEMSLQEAAFEIMDAGLLVDQERRKILEKATMLKWAKYQTILDGLSGRKINANSPKQVQELLYNELKLPVKRKKEGGITTDEDAIVALVTHVQGKLNDLKTDRTRADWHRKLGILRCVLGIRGTRKMLSSYILATPSCDGRIRSTVSVAATETGRWSMSKYIDDTGVNSQTFPRDPIDVPDNLDINSDVPINLLDGEDEEDETGS